jgi:copper chaperone CopZ
MYSTFLVSKTECMACNNEVLKTLGTLQGVFGAEMDRIEGRIVVSHTDEVSRTQIAEALSKLGFPERKEDPEHDEPSIWGCVLKNN